MFWTTLLSTLIATAASSAPLGAALGLTGLIILQFFVNGATSLALNAVWNVLNEFTLSAIPLFIIMGEVMLASGVSQRIYAALSTVFNRVPGNLLHTNIAVCTVFGAISGSSLSTAAAVGAVAYPEMSQRGYDRRMVVGSLAGGGTLGLLIPPSLSLLIYGSLTETSIGQLFLGGIIPGLLMALCFMAYILVRCLRDRSLYPVEPELQIPFLQKLKSLLSIWPVAGLVFAVMGTIVLGIATPTEASGVGALGASLLAIFRGRLSFSDLKIVIRKTTHTTAYIFALFVGATMFALILRGLGGDELIEGALKALPFGTSGVVIVVLFVAFLLGFFLDWIEITLIVLPLVAPVVTGLGFDLIWFTVMFAVCLQTAFLTPPVGFAIFYLKGVAPSGVQVATIYRGVMPFIGLQLLALVLLFFVRDLALWLPSVAS